MCAIIFGIIGLLSGQGAQAKCDVTPINHFVLNFSTGTIQQEQRLFLEDAECASFFPLMVIQTFSVQFGEGHENEVVQCYFFAQKFTNRSVQDCVDLGRFREALGYTFQSPSPIGAENYPYSVSVMETTHEFPNTTIIGYSPSPIPLVSYGFSSMQDMLNCQIKIFIEFRSSFPAIYLPNQICEGGTIIP